MRSIEMTDMALRLQGSTMAFKREKSDMRRGGDGRDYSVRE